MRLPHDRSSAGVARHLLEDALREWHVPQELIDDTLLVVSELVTNAVLHGVPIHERPGVAEAIELQWEIEPQDGLRLGVRDGGSGAVVYGVRPNPTADRGRGLSIVAQLSQEWGVVREPAGATVWARLHR